MKTIFLPGIALLLLAPAMSHADEPATQRFEHKGSTYVYTVTQVGDHRVINGVD